MEEKAALKEVHDAVKQHYELINAAFTFYATGGSTSCFHMGLNNFTSMLEDCKVCTAPLCCLACPAAVLPCAATPAALCCAYLYLQMTVI